MSIFDDVMNSKLTDSVGATAIAVRKDSYHQLVALNNVHSYSMQQSLQACPRRYQLMVHEAAMRVDGMEIPDETNATFAFGHAVGAGVAEYDRTRSLDDACFAAFLAWNIDLFDCEPKRENRPDPKKSFIHAIWALYGYEVFYQEDQEANLSEYEVVNVEANVGVDFEDGFYYTAHIDELLRSTITGQLKVKENKTTSFATVDPAMYQNSDQALGYAVVVDSIQPNQEYSVLYTIYSSTEQRWIGMEFTKTPLSKVEWIRGQLLLNAEVQEYARLDFFPKRGRSCVEFGRRCKYFDSCSFDTRLVYRKKFSELDGAASLGDIEKRTGVPFDYKFTLSDLRSGQRDAQRL